MSYIIRDIELGKINEEPLLPESELIVNYFTDLFNLVVEEKLDDNCRTWRIGESYAFHISEDNKEIFIIDQIEKDLNKLIPGINDEMIIIDFMIRQYIDLDKNTKLYIWIPFQKEIWFG